jgi:hypothetical protein
MGRVKNEEASLGIPKENTETRRQEESKITRGDGDVPHIGCGTSLPNPQHRSTYNFITLNKPVNMVKCCAQIGSAGRVGGVDDAPEAACSRGEEAREKIMRRGKGGAKTPVSGRRQVLPLISGSDY